MLTRLSISNFQSHRESHLDLSEGVTVLLGPSRSGKSAVLRALRWLFENKTPTGFRSHWGGDTEIALMVDGKSVARRRTKKDNQYRVGGMNPFEKVGAGNPPKEVVELLDISPISLQWQHDTPFLLNDSPAEVARRLNKAVNLEVIDLSMSRIASMERGTAAELKTRRKDLETIEGRLSGFDGLGTLDGELKVVETLERATLRNKDAFTKLNTIVDGIGTIEGPLRKARRLAAVDISIVEDLVAVNMGVEKEFSSLSEWVRSVTEMRESLELAKKVFRHEKELASLEDAWVELKRLGKERHDLSNAINEILCILGSLEESDCDLNRLARQWKEAMPDECPLCGRSCDCGQKE